MRGVRSPTLITLGRTIRIYREAAGMIQKELAHKLGYTNAWLSNVETAQLRPRQEQLTAIEEALKIPPGVLMGIHTQLDVESLPGYLRSWTEEEDRASVLRTFHVALVPDLLQTEDYARALLADDEPAVRTRLERQAILTREDPRPPKLHCVLDEAVLLRSRGPHPIMRDQLLHLVKSVSPPRLTVQILRADDNPHRFGAFTIATVDDGEVGRIETPSRDIITNNREDIAGLLAAWEATRTFALSQRESIELIQAIAEERWT